jgi:hypothetical protein
VHPPAGQQAVLLKKAVGEQIVDLLLDGRAGQVSKQLLARLSDTPDTGVALIVCFGTEGRAEPDDGVSSGQRDAVADALGERQ